MQNNHKFNFSKIKNSRAILSIFKKKITSTYNKERKRKGWSHYELGNCFGRSELTSKLTSVPIIIYHGEDSKKY